jgi:hypothetical protein
MLISTTALHADVTGSISGVVRDRSQAVVVGAKVVVTNTETNQSQTTATGADGTYRFLALAVGHYKITVTSNGFRPATITNIDLKVNDQLSFDFDLDLGQVQDEVSISANAVQVQTESTQLGDVMDSKKMLALPLNGRSYIDLLGLQAGVAPGTAGTIQQDRPVSGGLSAGNISVNGQRETANAFLVNGADVSEGRNLGAGLVPNIDGIGEFRLITNSFDAEYGKFSGAVVNVITKSGTNGFHGDAFEFLRNDKLDAKNYFTDGKSELRRNQFGYTFGGPVWKNKIFFFSDYQGTREVSGAETGQVNVPTLDQRAGNFGTALTGTVDSDYWAQVLNTRMGLPAGTIFQGESYNDVFPGGVIPQSAWDAPATNMLPFIPLPTNDQPTQNYSDNSQKNSVTDNKFGERIDFNNQMTGNWSWYYHLDNSNVNSALAGFASVPGFATSTPSRAQLFVMSNTKTFGATAVNESRFSVFRNVLHKDNPTESFASLASLGFVTGEGTLGIVPLAGYQEYVPQTSFANSGLNIGVPTLNTFQPNTTYAIGDVFSKSQGKHTWKVGGEFRYYQVNERNYANPNGGFTFNGNVTGDEFADFLLGATCQACSAPYTQAALQLLDSRTKYAGAFVQDAWRVKSNLTLNLGLRWDLGMPWYDTQGKLQAFVPGQQSTLFPNSPTGLVFPGDAGIPQTLAPTRYHNFGPRLGLAYSPGFSDGILGKIFGGPGKTSIRAAYGLYYSSVEDLNLFYEVADAPFGLYWTSPVSVLMDQPFQGRSGQVVGQRFPFTAPTPGDPANQTLDFSVYEPMNFFPGYDIHNRTPYAEHFNASIQRELTKSTVLTLAYVGTEGHHLITQSEANPGDPALCLGLATAIDTNGSGINGSGIGCGPGNENDTFLKSDGSFVYSTRHSLLNPNFCPQSSVQICFGYGNTYTQTIANSVYHSAQISVEHKSNTSTFTVAYTFSKAIDDASAFGDLVNFSDHQISRGLSSSDLTHNFVASYVWEIPFDRAFKGAPKRLTQGWQLEGITRFATGFPIQMGQSSDDISLVGSSSTDMPDRVGPVVTVNPRDANPNCPTGTGCYFLPSAFAPNTTLGTFGTSNRRFFHGPGFNNTDFGFLKHTKIRESLAFDVRVEFFNIFNHTQFTNPGGDINSDNFGIVTSARDPRIGQVSAKFYW